MEKIKDVFSKIGSAVKSHFKIVIIVVAVVIVAILALSFLGGKEKRAVKKYLSALNSYEKDKILKAIDDEAACVGIGYTKESIEEFEDKIDDVKDEQKDNLADNIKEAAKNRKESKTKYKLQKVLYVTKAKDNKDIKLVGFKYKRTSKPTEDEKDDAKDNDIWEKVKLSNESETGYGTAILYKNKVISCSISGGVSTQASSYDYNY